MHIPDGFLDLWICAVMYAVSIAVILYSSYKLRGGLRGERAPLIGVVAAGIFAAQMLNWPIPGGTSAHLVGGAIAGIVLGPFAGCLSISSVLTIQCLVFGDGGITALGANIFNMAVVGPFLGYGIYKLFRSFQGDLASFLAGWIAVWVGAVACGIEIGVSSIFHYSIVSTVSVMGIGHGILGIVEGVITMLIIRYLTSNRPDLLYTSPHGGR